MDSYVHAKKPPLAVFGTPKISLRHGAILNRAAGYPRVFEKVEMVEPGVVPTQRDRSDMAVRESGCRGEGPGGGIDLFHKNRPRAKADDGSRRRR
jgi:hypothetical protein